MPYPQISRVYQDGPFLWVPEAHLTLVGILAPEADLVVQLTGAAPDGRENVSGDPYHLYVLEARDNSRDRWWVTHQCCFTNEMPGWLTS